MEALKDLKPANMDAERERCLPGTRMEILRDLFITLIDPNPDSKVTWLCGPAGSGKSTILNTLAQSFLKLRRQGAFLFWDRNDADNSEPRHVIHTLAYQLARFDPIFAAELQSQMKTWPHITESSLDVQFQHLLQGPLTTMAAKHDCGPIVIVL